MQIIRRTATFDIAEAFGLGRESLRHVKHKDTFGPVVINVPKMCGYTTAITADDVLRETGSVLAVTDGYDTHLPFDWRRRYHPHRPKELLGYVKGFQLYRATFAATEVSTKYGGIPERIFLFHNSPGFNLTKIIDRLRRYRKESTIPLVPEALKYIELRSLV